MVQEPQEENVSISLCARKTLKRPRCETQPVSASSNSCQSGPQAQQTVLRSLIPVSRATVPEWGLGQAQGCLWPDGHSDTASRERKPQTALLSSFFYPDILSMSCGQGWVFSACSCIEI